MTTPIPAAGKILILASSSTGNNIFCTPAIRLIKKHRPNARIDVVALNKLCAEVFTGNPSINEVFVIDSRRAFDKLAKNYDRVLCLNANAQRKLKTQTAMDNAGHLSADSDRAEQLLHFAAGLLQCEITDEDRAYFIHSTPEQGAALLAQADVAPDAVLICIHLGTGTTKLHGWKFFYAKRADDKRLWPVDEYIKLGRALVAGNPKIRIIITGTRNETFLAKQFEREVPGTINLVGKTSVADLHSLMRRVNLFIAHDCGVFHIAAATEVPIVGLYGPTDPVFAGPYPRRPQHRLIKKATMAEITVPEVVEAAFELIAKYPR
ncbi:MAG: glycosyltransferase family 9 protein [Methylobacillus sp.]|jgi:ADP-heptose:LPS heptosyltransferase|nr:glycosyltransferase family 9 protein [Methylobacillus sp.]